MHSAFQAVFVRNITMSMIQVPFPVLNSRAYAFLCEPGAHRMLTETIVDIGKQSRTGAIALLVYDHCEYNFATW